MDDGTHFYVDAGSGEVVARRTRFWRVYDFMWGLHIMDLQGREDTHNPWVVGFALVAAGDDPAGAGAAAAGDAQGSRAIKPAPSNATSQRLRALGRGDRRPAGSRGSAPGCSARP